MTKKKTKINVKGTEIAVVSDRGLDFISLTDMVRNFEGGSALIEQWLKNKDTVLFLGAWEKINNSDFNSPEFEGIKNEAGRNSFFLSAKKWAEATNAKGLYASAGRYGGTFAHRDIAFEFGSWLSPEFKLYLITEFQRLKEDENRRLSLEWNLNRNLARLNYRIHTDAIKENIVPPKITAKQKKIIYANEADLLNVALYGKTAADWRAANPSKEGNIRDYSTIEQLLVMANLESLNAEFIRNGIDQGERLRMLNQAAINQLKALSNLPRVKKLSE
jgi:hypothetical protein